jgi:hypothetical protein
VEEVILKFGHVPSAKSGISNLFMYEKGPLGNRQLIFTVSDEIGTGSKYWIGSSSVQIKL